MNLSNKTEPFSKWRRRLWPVRQKELSKLIPLLLMKFCVSFNFAILHATKDTLTVTSKNSGAEAIPILKGWVVLFFAFIVMLAYSKLSNHLNRSRLFYASITPFLAFFLLYGFFLYPNRDWLCPHETSDWLVSIIGKNREHWIAVYRYWMDSCFFLFAELWGGVVIALLFWGFANQISTVHEASRFYTLFSAGGHVGMISSGPLIYYFANHFSNEEFGLTLKCLMAIAFAIGCVIIYCYWWIDRNFVSKDTQVVQTTKLKLSLRESLATVVSSPYLGCIAIMVIGYSLSVNMVEVSWKALLKMKYPIPKDYQAFMGIISSITGCVSLFLALFVGGNVIRKFGWHFGAQLTPLVLGVCTLGFFGYYYLSTNLISEKTLLVIVIIGAVHSVACKSMKYCLFDPTKEMAYIPLDEEFKVKGKAAVDVVASRFGKSGSSWIQAALIEFAGVGSVLQIAPYLTPFAIIAVVSWMFSAYALKSKFNLFQSGSRLNEIKEAKTA